MGTKRVIAPVVRAAIQSCGTSGRAADLFAGMGAIAHALSADRSVLLNDALAFPTVFARAHCLQSSVIDLRRLIPRIYELFIDHRLHLREQFRQRIAREDRAIEDGQLALRQWIRQAPHVGNSRRFLSISKEACASKAESHFQLATLYFSASYFSTRQAIDLDALRFAFKHIAPSSSGWPVLLAVWLATASRIINSPGHSAQFMQPTSRAGLARLSAQWRRDVWAVFSELASQFSPWGSSSWRRNNSVTQSDALDLINDSLPDDVAVVYADPPYTKDQYSRFYHVFETLLLYDFPVSAGHGRYRDDRFQSTFCRKSTVVDAFATLFAATKNRRIPLVLSYPTDGLLSKAGVSVFELLRDYFSNVRAFSIPSTHSTMGGSKGDARKRALEQVFVCK